jgi:uncharacterized 2Fe-2S/4Fe-4S cluster protein (DUF4445 family)
MGKVIFPQFKRGREGVESRRETLLELARGAGIEIAAECGGQGSCRKCVVSIESGEQALCPPTPPELEAGLDQGERLACQARVEDTSRNVHVLIRAFGRYSILTDSTGDVAVEPEPFAERREGRVLLDGSPAGEAPELLAGLAVDVGTTTLVVEAVNLESGESLGRVARLNPQIEHGNDVISRISFAMTRADGAAVLQRQVFDAVNGCTAELGIAPETIYEAVLVGNSTMISAVAGRDLVPLGGIPFEPASKAPEYRAAASLGLEANPAARVYFPALIGGHAGADCLADILASGMYRREEVSAVIDIGTNGEVAVGNRERIMTASCAAGGAYEGAAIRCGIGAIDGAIARVKLDNGRVDFETIGDKEPVGICGSGLIDLLAELLRAGTMSKKARLKEDFQLCPGISLGQSDIYQLITAKAGLRLDQDLLIGYYGVGLDDVAAIYLAGGFGNYVDAANACAIGLLPPAPEKVVKIGNGALAGARAMLLSRSLRTVAEELPDRIEHVKPNEREEDFPYMVAEKMYFE